MANGSRIVVILGPTAGGKSALAVGIAQTLGGEIISADSMQVYRHLNAGTAKPTPAERAAAPHWLIDIVEPTDSFTVADWLQRCEGAIAELHRRGKLPIVVGGTNLYIKALLEGLFDGPAADEAFRAALGEVDSAELHRRLQQVDPAAAARIHINDRKRMIRALEVFHTTGKRISDQQQQWVDQGTGNGEQGAGQASSPKPQAVYRHDPILIGLDWPTEAINRRINQRVRLMFSPADGSEDLITETRRLLDAGLLGDQAKAALGTKQVLAHFAGEYDADKAMEQVKIETRRFAKSQRTWLKRYRGVHWLAADCDMDELIDQAIAIIRPDREPDPEPDPEGRAI